MNSESVAAGQTPAGERGTDSEVVAETEPEPMTGLPPEGASYKDRLERWSRLWACDSATASVFLGHARDLRREAAHFRERSFYLFVIITAALASFGRGDSNVTLEIAIVGLIVAVVFGVLDLRYFSQIRLLRDHCLLIELPMGFDYHLEDARTDIANEVGLTVSRKSTKFMPTTSMAYWIAFCAAALGWSFVAGTLLSSAS
ncbi:MAG: hypothetical protein RIM72_07710 [Alphaproteobacteria bacterium]|jgi:phosphate/sulfate permease